MFGSLSCSIKDPLNQESEFRRCRRLRLPIPDLPPSGLTRGVAARFLPYNPAKTSRTFDMGAMQMLHQLPAAGGEATPSPAAPQSPDRVPCNPVIEQTVTAR